MPGAALALAVAGAVVTTSSTTAHAETQVPRLQLVTLIGPGTSANSPGAGSHVERAHLTARQDAVLASIGSPATTYRWTTALNGFAAELTPDQVNALETNSEVAEVELNSVLPMSSSLTAEDGPRSRAASPAAPGARGGSGVVIGFVDSGLSPDTPLFAEVPGLGPDSSRYRGECSLGDGWAATTCNRKVVGAGWWVSGFGADRVRSSEHLSALDASGHGTQVASVAAGNADVSVRMRGRSVGSFSGIAPRARVAPYKACWAAPDPADDGCATADLVSAIDRATADGVDVLNMSIAGSSAIDTVERALLGAAEADIVVVGAAGNDGRTDYAAHASPWVTTVGATRGAVARGQVAVVDGPVLAGASRSRASIGPVRLVSGADAAARGVRLRDARQCRPGSLDARLVAGRAVLCVRGGIGRVDKSKAVSQADGVAMVLINVRPGSLTDDFHSVPTVQLPQGDGRRLVRWLRTHPRTAVRMSSVNDESDVYRAAPWSAGGDARSTLLKPDVLAPGEGILGAVPTTADGGWAVFSGTSAAAAHVSGLAAQLRADHPWSASVVRSVLSTTASPLPGTSTLTQGAGRVGDSLPRAGLALDVPAEDYRRSLEALSWRNLNVSSIVTRGAGTTTRRVTNLGKSAEYFSSQTFGFADHQVRITPVALRLGPGESATVRITVANSGPPGRLDDGWVLWRGARGSQARIPVAITR